MSESKIEWQFYVPLSLIGYLFVVLLIATYNQEWLLSPMTLPHFNRLSLLTFSLFGGILFFGMIQFGFYVWRASLFIVKKLTSIFPNGSRSQEETE